jgi:hypothetical protein
VHVSTSQATENVIYPGEQGPRGANWPVNQSRGAATASVTCLGLLFSPSPLLSLSLQCRAIGDPLPRVSLPPPNRTSASVRVPPSRPALSLYLRCGLRRASSTESPRRATVLHCSAPPQDRNLRSPLFPSDSSLTHVVPCGPWHVGRASC